MRPRPRSRPLARALFRVALVTTALVGFGVTTADVATYVAFADAVKRWQSNPEFRTAATEYCVLGSAATRSRPFFVGAGGLVMGVRSIPGLPKEYAVSDTSQAHYDAFGAGPLSAYLHLCGEQDVPGYTGAVEQLGNPAKRDEASLRAWLDARRMDFPIVRDRGAAQSLASLVTEVDPSRSLAVRSNVAPLLQPHVAAVATALGVPPDPAAMTAAQQHAVLDRLDAHVRRADPELWRAKQVSDFAGGIWAQVFGPAYNQLLLPFLAVHAACRWAFVLLLAWLLVRRRVLDPRPAPDAVTAPQPDAPEPRAATTTA